MASPPRRPPAAPCIGSRMHRVAGAIGEALAGVAAASPPPAAAAAITAVVREEEDDLVDIEARTNGLLGDSGKICRICHGGPEDGRLISPCLCKGSMKYVHIACLQRWRSVGGSKHYFRCDTCRYEYQLRRVAWAQWLSKAWVTHILTIAAMLYLVLIAGYAGRILGALSSEVTERLQVEEFRPAGQESPAVDASTTAAVTAATSTATASSPSAAWDDAAPDSSSAATDGNAADGGFAVAAAASSSAAAASSAATPPPPPSSPALLARRPRLRDGLGGERGESPPPAPLTFPPSPAPRTSWRDNWTWSFLSVEHFVAGTTVVGLTSFFVLFVTFPGVFFQGDLGAVGGRAGSHLEFVILMAVIAIGVVKAFLTLQRLVLERTRNLVLRAEEHILEVRAAGGGGEGGGEGGGGC